jgi:hypothetical protein
MKWIVNNPDGYATKLRSFRGGTLTLTNSSAVDIYYDIEAAGGSINSTAPGVIPTGTKIAATGGTIQFQDCPDNIWVRAISQTVLDVQGDAAYASEPPSSVRAGDGRGSNNVPPPNEKPIINIGSAMIGRQFQFKGRYHDKRGTGA